MRVGFGAEHALSAVYNTEGFGVALTDAEIIRGQREIAKLEGIFCEVSSAAAVAAVAKATRMGKISGDDTVAAILTGSGFKEYFPTFDDISEVPIAKSPDAIPETIRKRFAHD